MIVTNISDEYHDRLREFTVAGLDWLDYLKVHVDGTEIYRNDGGRFDAPEERLIRILLEIREVGRRDAAGEEG